MVTVPPLRSVQVIDLILVGLAQTAGGHASESDIGADYSHMAAHLGCRISCGCTGGTAAVDANLIALAARGQGAYNQ